MKGTLAVAIMAVTAACGPATTGAAPGSLAATADWRWRAPDAGNIGAPAADAAGVVVPRPGLALVAFDRAGNRRWAAPEPRLRDVAPLLAGRLVVASTDYALVAFERATGARIWSSPVGTGASSPVLVGDVIVAVAGKGEVVAVRRNGDRAWAAQLPDRTLGQPPAGGDGVVVATWRSGVTALDAATGRTRWERALPALPSGPAVSAGVVVVLDGAGVAHGMNLSDGLDRWADDRPAAGQPEVPPTVLRSGVVVVADQLTGMAAYDVVTGRRRWFLEGPGAAVRGGPVGLGGATDTVALPDDLGTVLVLDRGRDLRVLDPAGRVSGVARLGRGRLVVATRDAERNQVIVYRVG